MLANSMNKLRFRCSILDYRRIVSILMCNEDSSGQIIRTIEPFVLTVREYDGGPIERGTWELDFDVAQNLLDTLIDAGMKPKKTGNKDGEIARMGDHLKDLQRIVFKGYK